MTVINHACIASDLCPSFKEDYIGNNVGISVTLD